MQEFGIRRAHSVQAHGWQIIAALAAAVSGLALPGAAPAANEGLIGVLNPGLYGCELPGDAEGVVGRHMADEDFAIIRASTYQVGNRRGAYLLVGDTVVMTTGPLRGARYRRITDNFLRKLNPDRSEGRLRCIRNVPNNEPSD